MSKIIDCPECKDEITYLNYSGEQKVSWNGTATFDEKRKQLEHDQDFSSTDYPDSFEGDVEYSCPECDAILFANEEEAKEYWQENSKEESD